MHSQLYIRIMRSKEWKVARERHKAAHPLCELCLKEGRSMWVQCVHHITPIESARTEAEAWQLATSDSNLQSLCFKHHSAIHAAERSHSKEGHRQRQSERLQQWIHKHVKQ